MRAHLILFVTDQAESTQLFRFVLGQEPELDVPGMTEFVLQQGCVLGLMPRAGIQRLLGRSDVGQSGAELYLEVADPQAFHDRALAAGAELLSPLAPRDWGADVAYSRIADGTILAFARRISA